MKFNKWTLGLAAVGVVSLASAAKAEERASSVLTALSSTTLSGYVDVSAQWNFGTGNHYMPPYKFGGPGKADGFNLDVVQLRLDKPLDESDWAAGYRVDLWMGPDATALGTQSYMDNGEDFALRQAYVALRVPIGKGLDFKVGVFDSIIGYESVESGNNPNYTRSYGHTIEPQTHTGVLATYRFSDLVSASVGIANTVGPSINERAFPPYQYGSDAKAESYKTYMGSVALTAPDSLGFLAGSTLYAGVVNGYSGSYEGNQTSYYLGATVATPVTGLRLGAAYDQLDVHNPNSYRGGDTWAVSGYASFQATEKLSLHARAEYLKDCGRQKFFEGYYYDYYYGQGLSDDTLALTLTAQYDLWKNVLSRLELRWDHSLNNENVFGSSTYEYEGYGEPTRGNAWMLAANIIYKF
jgi:hypothetical protein